MLHNSQSVTYWQVILNALINIYPKYPEISQKCSLHGLIEWHWVIYSRIPPWHSWSSGMTSTPLSPRGPLHPASCSSQCLADSNRGLRNCTENIRCPMHPGLRPSTAARWFNFTANSALHNSTNLASYSSAPAVRLDIEILHVDLPPLPRGVGEVIQWEPDQL